MEPTDVDATIEAIRAKSRGNHITITVHGTTGSGKTAICQLIIDELTRHGISIVGAPEPLSASMNYAEKRSPQMLTRTLLSLGDANLMVTVHEMNMRKDT